MSIDEGVTSESRLFFMHIAKAAGTSVNEYFVDIFGKDRCAVHLESNNVLLRALCTLEYAHIKFASGHLRLPDIKRLVTGDGWRVFTIIRDPLDHILSHLRWVKYIGSAEAVQFRSSHSKSIQEMSLRLAEIPFNDLDKMNRFIFEEFAEGRQLFDNCQTRYFLPFTDGVLAEMMMETMTAHLMTLDYISTLEQANELLYVVCRENCAITKKGQTLNVTNTARNREELVLSDKSVKDYYVSLTRFDTLLYEKAKRIGEDILSRSLPEK